MNKKLFEIVDMRTTDNAFISKRHQICDLTTHKKAMANLCIKYTGIKKLGSSIFINDEAFYEAITNADESVKKNILKALAVNEVQEAKEVVEEKTKVIKEKIIEPVVEEVKKAIAKVNPVKAKVKKAVKEVKEYNLNDNDKELLGYDISDLGKESKNMITRYWNKLTKLADNAGIDYTKVEAKDFKALRSLFDNNDNVLIQIFGSPRGIGPHPTGPLPPKSNNVSED